MPESVMEKLSPDPQISIRRVGAACGAEISGVDLSQPIDDARFADIESALVAHEVIVFRDQNISTEDQKSFGRRFGELTVHPFAPMSGIPMRLFVPSRHWAPCCGR
jgi:taurine dioxygenase